MGKGKDGGNERMNPQYSHDFPIPGIDFNSILPMLIVTITGLVALLVEILRPPQKNKAIVAVSLIGLLGAAAVLLQQSNMADGETLAGMVVVDRFGLVMQLLVVLSCFLCICFSESYLRQKRIPFGEFYPLILWSSVGAMLMATSKNLLVIFLGLEVLSIALYVMAGMSRSEE
jgi:NADH-quinone oxidoreductase subunit N